MFTKIVLYAFVFVFLTACAAPSEESSPSECRRARSARIISIVIGSDFFVASGAALEAYYTEWRTFQMSDHLPLWVELKIDFSNEYLNYLGTYTPANEA